jgi:3-oxoacyl-[acyl-carrier-protein] synthase-3
MALLSFKGVGISAIAACVPKNKVNNLDLTEYFSPEAVQAIVEGTQVYERRQVSNEICSSDLAVAAAERLLLDNQIDKDEIGALIFVSQTPDYRMPATAFFIQKRLGLSQNVFAFDVNLACAGFIQGLCLAFSLLQNAGISKVLLLNGETRTKVYSRKDRRGAFLFGDASTATMVERSDKFGCSHFSIGSDGGFADLVMIPGGGYRNPSSSETLKEKIADSDGNIRCDEHSHMAGEDVASLFIRVMPKHIKSLLERTNTSMDSIDYFILHEGSNFLASFIKKKLKLPEHKTPSILSKYGNTSSASIPLNIVSELNSKLMGEKRLLLTALGAGMTWATAILDTKDMKVSDMVEL